MSVPRLKHGSFFIMYFSFSHQVIGMKLASVDPSLTAVLVVSEEELWTTNHIDRAKYAATLGGVSHVQALNVISAYMERVMRDLALGQDVYISDCLTINSDIVQAVPVSKVHHNGGAQRNKRGCGKWLRKALPVTLKGKAVFPSGAQAIARKTVRDLQQKKEVLADLGFESLCLGFLAQPQTDDWRTTRPLLPELRTRAMTNIMAPEADLRKLHVVGPPPGVHADLSDTQRMTRNMPPLAVDIVCVEFAVDIVEDSAEPPSALLVSDASQVSGQRVSPGGDAPGGAEAPPRKRARHGVDEESPSSGSGTSASSGVQSGLQ